jgi:hypothetical protein
LGDAILHQSQCVEHLNHRHVPFGFEHFSGDARHPVMAVDQIVVNAFFSGKTDDVFCKGGDVSGEFRFG